jgi:hypothetical protein
VCKLFPVCHCICEPIILILWTSVKVNIRKKKQSKRRKNKKNGKNYNAESKERKKKEKNIYI